MYAGRVKEPFLELLGAKGDRKSVFDTVDKNNGKLMKVSDHVYTG